MYGSYSKNTNVGDVFGSFTVVEKPSGGKVRVQCKCGNYRNQQVSELHQGRRKSCGCDRVTHQIGEIVNGRRVVKRGTKLDPCLTVECLNCGHQAKIRAGYQKDAVCRNCTGFDKRLSENGTVYALTCPYTGDVKYIGATRHGLDKRMRDHFKSRLHPKKMHKPVYVWIRELEKNGARAGIVTIEEVHNGDLKAREVFWIKKSTQEGANLFNIDHNMKPKQEAEDAPQGADSE